MRLDTEFLNNKITQMEKRMDHLEKKLNEQYIVVQDQVELEITKKLVPLLAVPFIADKVGLGLKKVKNLREEYIKSH